MHYTENMLREMQELIDEGMAEEASVSQNKNNKKVPITEVAIRKIPYVEYPGISKEDCKRLHELEKHLLKLSKTENFSNEVAITYRLYKEPGESEEDRVATVFGDEHEVDLGADTKTFHLLQSDYLAVINMHNHPNCSNFSLYDVSFFLRNDSIKLMILLSNKGELNYILKNEKYNRKSAIGQFVKSCAKVQPKAVNGLKIDLKKITEKDMVKAANIWLKESKKLGINYEHIKDKKRGIFHGKSQGVKKRSQRGFAPGNDIEWER